MDSEINSDIFIKAKKNHIIATDIPIIGSAHSDTIGNKIDNVQKLLNDSIFNINTSSYRIFSDFGTDTTNTDSLLYTEGSTIESDNILPTNSSSQSTSRYKLVKSDKK